MHLQQVTEWAFVLLNVYAGTLRCQPAADNGHLRVCHARVLVCSCAVRPTSSVMESREDVASSYRRTGGFFSIARAMATRCFSPPETKQQMSSIKANQAKAKRFEICEGTAGLSPALSHQIITSNRGPTLRQYQCYRLQTGKTDLHLIEKKNQQDAKISPTVFDSAFITYELCVAS